MRLNNYELKKLFDFIIVNRNITITDDSLFNRDTLIMLRDIIKEKRPNDFELTKEQEKYLINAFLNGNCIFDEETPSFILKNDECINAAIDRDVNSANYIEYFNPRLLERVRMMAINQKYILKPNSPAFLKNNYAIALNSIRQDANSANFVDWKSFSKEDYDDLIEETIKSGYELSKTTNYCIDLAENEKIVLNSIKRNPNTIQYVSYQARQYPEVFKFLLVHDFDFSTRELEKHSLNDFSNDDAMMNTIKKFEFFDKNDDDFKDVFADYPDSIDKYIERFSRLFSNAISIYPTINNFKSVFEECAETEWDAYRACYIENYTNIFGKICTELKNTNNFNEAIKSLEFLVEMKSALEDKFNLLMQAMKQYHVVIHSNSSLEQINVSRDTIAKLSALYVSKSKENYKKTILESYNEYIKEFFIPRKNHPVIYKKTIEKKQKEKFNELYSIKDERICNFLNNLVVQCSETFDENLIWNMIDNFVKFGYSKMDSFIKAPRGFNNYKRYEEASKLVNRLNSKYIKYTDQEVIKYMDIIIYDNETGKYRYQGPLFDAVEVSKYNEYRKKQKIFEKVKKEIIFKARTLDIDKNIDNSILKRLEDELPFNDEYFEFALEYYKKNFNFGNLLNGIFVDTDIIEPSSILDDESYSLLTNYVINNGLVWLLLFLNKNENESLIQCGIDKETIMATMDYMSEVIKLAKQFNYDINNYSDVMSLCELSICADDQSLAILGKDVIVKLCRYQEYTNEDAQEIVRIAKELVCEMAKRDKSTVPYIKGSTTNYVYSMYDSQDETLLLSGINTNACFRVDGNDNDFLHYCALDKNGFVIKITDTFGNFIARAAGFRNGNSVYINQLRTIYDEGGYGYEGSYANELKEIIETFREACLDIVEKSQNNENEKDKIDFVFVTKSYALDCVPSNVNIDVVNKIGNNPMDHDSQDWKDFVTNTQNLQENDTFTTDYGNYSLLCMASTKTIGRIKPKDIKPKDVQAVYNRPRNKIIATENLDANIMSKINKINGIYSYFNETEFESALIPKGTIIFMGDNWYIAYSNGAISSSCVLDFDKKAQIEYESTKRTIQEYALANNQQIDIEQVSHQFEQNRPEGYARILRINH